MEKKQKPLIIAGANINFKSKDWDNVKSAEDVAKLGIFDHLSTKEQEDAHGEVLTALESYRNPKVEESTSSVVTEKNLSKPAPGTVIGKGEVDVNKAIVR